MEYQGVGVPPSQPRHSKFVPRSGRVGKGKVRGAAAAVDAKITPSAILNEELLRSYEVDMTPNARVAAGDVITVAKPFVKVLATSCRGIRCEACFKVKKIKVICPRCNYAYYCSEGCLLEDAEEHEGECKLISGRRRGAGGPSSDTNRFVLRLLLKTRSIDRVGKSCDLVPGLPELRAFSDLVDHYDDILEKGNIRLDMVNAAYEEVLSMMGESTAPDPDHFLECYGRMAVNSFNVLSETGEGIGTALYLGPSIMDHSCRPNATVSFEDGYNIVVRALEPMESRDFKTGVRISYIDQVEHAERRQRHLLTNYYFECGCPRCKDASDEERLMFAAHCSACDQDVDLKPSKNDQDEPDLCCPNCGRIKYVEDYEEVYELVECQLDKAHFPLDVAKFCLSLMDRFSH